MTTPIQQVQRRRGTTAEHVAFTGALGETTVDTTKHTVVVHDGVTPGGFPLALEGAGGASPLTTKGDVYTHDATVNQRLPVGADGTLLVADSSKTTGLDWKAQSVAVDHGSIGGLADDDHAQYLRTDGTRALTGNISAGTHKITNLALGSVSSDAATKGQMDTGDAAVAAAAVNDGDPAGGDLTGTYPNPTIAALAVTDAKVAAANKDGASGTASMRTLGTGAAQACAGNDSRLSDSRAPNGTAGGDLTGTYPNPTVAALAITDAKVAAANKDGIAATASMRTLGTGAQQACAGNDSRLSDSRAPNGSAGGDLTGTYPDPTLAVDRIAKSVLTTKGDLITCAVASTPIRHGVGADGTVLVASAVSADGWTNGDHGNLGGLTDDDHTQYTRADGTRAFTGDQSMGSHKLTNVTDPSSAQDAATKAYVDAIRTPTLPTVVSVGTEFHSTGVPTATLPGTHAANDILVLVLQSSNDSQVAAPAGYNQLGPENGIGAAATAGSTKLSVFWKRDGGSESAPTIPDTGDHTYGVMFAVRGCPTTGDPFHLGRQAWKFTASTAASSAASATWVDNTLVIDIFAHGSDIAVGQASGQTNANLTSLTEQFDGSTTDGTGGGIVVVSGTKAVAGGVAATTMTWDNSTVDVSTRIHFLPTTNSNRDFPAVRPCEVQNFIGSAADLDDTWVRPVGAMRVRAQIIDGGGSGSSGNTTTTAEGGGGGGGGGYDEGDYSPADIGSSATVHAGKGGAAVVGLNNPGNAGVISQFDKGGQGPLISAKRIAGTAATAAATVDGGDGGGGSGRGTTAMGAQTTRADLNILPAANNIPAGAANGGRGGSGTTAPTGGSPGDWGGGGGESGADTDAAIGAGLNGWSTHGGGGGSGGRTNGNISVPGSGGGATAVAGSQGAAGVDSTRLPYGGSGGVNGGTGTAAGGPGGFPGGGGGGGGGVANGNGGAGAHGMVVVTTYF